MSSIFDPVKGFGVTFATMFKPVVTEDYPKKPEQTALRYHGRHQLNRHPDGLEKCVGCELCAWACPADAIFVEGGDNTEEARFSPGERYGKNYQINYLRCIGCGLCIEACPTRSLTMTNEYELADDDRQRLIYTKDMLLAPLLPGMEQPPHPMTLGDEQDYYVRGPELVRQRPQPTVSFRPGGGVMSLLLTAAAAADTAAGAASTGEQIAFWILGPVSVLGALGMLFARNAVHSALWLVLTMLSVGCMYLTQGAQFLGLAQIIVYTGAIMMLFLFVLMLTGRESSDSLVEVLRGQRVAAVLLGIGVVGLLTAGVVRGLSGIEPAGLQGAVAGRGEIQSIAEVLFTDFLFPFELTSALLITAALGAMVLAHVERRPSERRGQRKLVEERMRSGRMSPLPGPGVFATPRRTPPRRCCRTARSRRSRCRRWSSSRSASRSPATTARTAT